jgi:stage III sporulation protein AH
MLKKQTVWLLTMLSLMIVLSVYYMISPGSEDLAYIEGGDAEQTTAETTDPESEAEIDDIRSLGGDELFTTIRMDLQDERSMKKDRLTAVVASSEASPEEKDQALSDIDAIEESATKESILEETIIQSNQYEDVLVRSDEDIVHVHVKTEELSDTEANHIMQMVRDEFGEMRVNVNFQPVEPHRSGEENEESTNAEEEQEASEETETE